MDADMEMQILRTNGNDKAVMAAHNGDGAHSIPNASEGDGLLSEQNASCNGETTSSSHAVEIQNNQGNTYEPQEESAVCRIQRELNEVVFHRVRLWMIIIFIFVIIIVVILISLAVCSAIHEDADENFDSSLFNISRYFNGSFQLPNKVFTEEYINLSSSGSQELAAVFQKKLADLYSSSPALGRYFSEAGINGFRNGSVIADFKLKFLMPEDQQDQLRSFTLSREMVYNVLRQFLYDQEEDTSDPMYIDPHSLKLAL